MLRLVVVHSISSDSLIDDYKVREDYNITIILLLRMLLLLTCDILIHGRTTHIILDFSTVLQ
jgi:hypothetical protein